MTASASCGRRAEHLRRLSQRAGAADRGGRPRWSRSCAYAGAGKESGVEVEAKIAHVHTFRDGKVAPVESYEDRDEALRAAGVSPSASAAQWSATVPSSGSSGRPSSAQAWIPPRML